MNRGMLIGHTSVFLKQGLNILEKNPFIVYNIGHKRKSVQEGENAL